MNKYQCHQKSSINNEVFEAVSVNMKISDTDFVDVVGIYRPPAGNISSFNNNLEILFNDINLKHNKSLVAGDFNICLFKGESDLNTRSFINLMWSYSLFLQICLPTREKATLVL